jgi:hypothetical protein
MMGFANLGGRRPVGGWSTAALAVSMFVAACVVVAGTPSADAATRQPASTVKGTAFSQNAIVCPTATTCLAGGFDGSGAVIVTVNGSSGAATVTGTDTAASSPFSGIACPTSTECVAVSGVGDSAQVNVASGAVGPNQFDSTDAPIYYAVVCPNANNCYAGGTKVSAGPSFTTTLTGLSPTAVPNTTTDGQSGQIHGLACVSATRCYAAVANGAEGDVVRIDNGTVDKTFATSFDGEAITCFQAVSCVEVGNIGESIYAAALNPTTGKPGRPRLIKNMSSVGGITCVTATECFAVGYRSSSGVLTARVSDIANGSPGSAKRLPGQSLAGVACSTATTCWAIGENTHGTGIVDSVPVPA